MAIYIQLNKIEEDGTGAIYEFGPVERIVGHVVVDKSDGAVELLDIDVEYAAREASIFLEFVACSSDTLKRMTSPTGPGTLRSRPKMLAKSAGLQDGE